MKGRIEKRAPLVMSLIIGGVIIFLYKKIELGYSFDNILNNIIVFISIMVGFVGVLMGVLFGLSQNEIIKKFFELINPTQLKHYYQASIFSGLIAVIANIIMFLRHSLGAVENYFVAVWSVLIVYAFLTTFRVMHITIYLIFSSIISENKEPEGRKMEDVERIELEEKYSE